VTASEHRLALPAGYQLGKYRLREVLGAGGFGITYLADDPSLGRRVAIKELLPNDIATRLDGTTVVAKTRSEEDNLAWARERFVDEGRALAACDHPNVVNVYEMIEANGTAYMVTKYEEGRSLERWLRELGRAPTEEELRGILLPLLAGLEKVHKAGFLHRDIKPENIYLTDEGRPVLLDFGSARQAVSNRSMAMTSIVTAGYAPFEQYHEDGHQGAWSDIYALGAVMFRAIAGRKPPEATRRMKDDPCPKLAREFAGKFSAQFLTAIDKALAVDAKVRPQSVAAWREQLGTTAPVADQRQFRRTWFEMWMKRLRYAPPAWKIGAAALLLVVVALAWQPWRPKPVPGTAAPPAPVISIATPTPATPLPLLEKRTTPAPLVRRETPAPATPAPIVRTATPPPATPAPVKHTGALAGPQSGQRWQNSLGMQFAPVPGAAVHLGVWPTRRADFEAFSKATGYSPGAGMLGYSSGVLKATTGSWQKPGFTQKADHPVVGVSAYDAAAFCRWLTESERAAGIIDRPLAYRLPTDEEWSAAAGASTYPWGDVWPPPRDAGNFAGEEMRQTFSSRAVIGGWRDAFTSTAPVGKFAPNAQGFHDLGGNVFEWCATWYRRDMNPPELRERDPALNIDEAAGAGLLVLRGSSAFSSTPQSLLIAHRAADPPIMRAAYLGFRCVLGPEVAPLLPPTPPVIPPATDAPGDTEFEVEAKLTGVWEMSGTGAKGPWTQRWTVRSDGSYSADGVIVDTGRLTASDGRIRQFSNLAQQWADATYAFDGTTLRTDGPFGPATWKRIGSAPTSSREKSSNSSNSSRSDSTRRMSEPERKAREIIRRIPRLPF
jgi:formylglycine-generating enzyme required for sulfatase activity/tRNA A-37 threonylcarbamoyl transferase component Bud32